MNASLRMNWLIAIALVGWLLYLLAPVLTPFVAAALLAYIGDPLADRLQRLKLPRTLAVVAVFVLTFLMVGLLVLLVGPLIRTQVGALLDALPEIPVRLSRVTATWPGAGEQRCLSEYRSRAVRCSPRYLVCSLCLS